MQLPNSNTAIRNLSAIVDFSNNINSNLNLDFALNNLLLTCFGKLLITKGMVILNDNNDDFYIALSKGVDKRIEAYFKLLKKKNNPEVIKEFATQHNFEMSKELVSSGKLLGFLVLGKKLNSKDYSLEDHQFINTIVKIGSISIGNAINFKSLTESNKLLDSKINQLNTIFDLGKEFSSKLEIEQISKLLVYSISAQMLVSKYAIIVFEDKSYRILDSKFDNKKIDKLLARKELSNLNEAKIISEENEFCSKCYDMGIKLIVPMMIKNKKKGIIFLGKRITNQEYSITDLEYIVSISSFAIISIENAIMLKETIEKQKLEKDLETARSIQQNLLPKFIPKTEFYEIAAINNTAKLVGGDFYDIKKVDEDNLIFAIADVSGKGMQAALLMANLQAFLKSIYKQNYNLIEASNLLNDLVSENTTNGSFITFFWGNFNSRNKTLSYVNMGHNPPLLIRDNKIRKLKKGGMILGVMQTVIPYEMEKIEIKKNDLLVLFTDGITEAMDINNQEYSDDRLEEICLKNSEKDCKSILNAILDDVNTHCKNAEQSDDITALIIKFY